MHAVMQHLCSCKLGASYCLTPCKSAVALHWTGTSLLHGKVSLNACLMQALRVGRLQCVQVYIVRCQGSFVLIASVLAWAEIKLPMHIQICITTINMGTQYSKQNAVTSYHSVCSWSEKSCACLCCSLPKYDSNFI